MTDELTPKLIEKLLSVDSPTISNAIEIFDIRSRREGYMGPEILCRFPDLGRAVGYAVTATIVEYDPKFPPDPEERIKWLEALANSPKPAICVIKDTTHRKGWSSHWGEITGTMTQELGSIGIVTDGAVRDMEALHAMGMKVWSEYVVVSHGHIDIGLADIPVEVGGLTVSPGDILHADCNGVVAIPKDLLDKLPGAIDEILDNEQRIIGDLRKNGFDVSTLRKEIKH